MADEEGSEPTYHPKDALGAAITGTAITGTAGLFVSTIQNSLARQHVGMMGIFWRTGGTITTFAAMGGAYEFTKNASANLREKDDWMNSSIGGFLAGTMLGFKFRSVPAVLGYGTGLSAILTAFTIGGSTLMGYKHGEEVDEVTRKEFLRKNRRRPVESTVHELGEGRGIYAPGYAERRADRIREAYGIDVTDPKPAVGSPSGP